MNDNVVIVYNGEQVSVPKEVADFLEQDRKREQAQEKQDARHLSKSEFETVLSGLECVKRPVEDAVLRNLRLENLRGAIAELDVQGQNLLSLRYSGELTLEEIGQIYQCWPSYTTIGNAVGRAKNTVMRYVDALADKGLISTEPTSVLMRSGIKKNGNLRYTILPIREAIEIFHARQLSAVERAAERQQVQRKLSEMDLLPGA